MTDVQFDRMVPLAEDWEVPQLNSFVEEITGKVRGFHIEALGPLAEQFAYPQPQADGEIKGAPLVLFLGNHSSGKSTFINHLLGTDVQKTGLAPTDDGFTIISYGEFEDNRDGPAVVNNPELPFEGLRRFGDQLVTHVRLKMRPITLLHDVTLIDSPGMIDEAKDENGRGFDFPGVVRWLAERADVVLVFFDPDKPGTTGETLQVFNQSLSGIDHKLLIVMNKMDQFRSLHDFARAYGALCWNLSKVIPRKDLPLIYNTFVPVENQPAAGLPLDDFDKAREELDAEVRRAPARRADNVLTQVKTFAERLRLHATVIDVAARDLRRYRMKLWGVLALLVLLIAAAGAVSIANGANLQGAILLVAAALAGGGGFLASRNLILREEKHSLAQLDETFERLYARDFVRDRSDNLRALWEMVRPRVRETAGRLGLHTFRKLRKDDLARLNQIIDDEIPSLRSELHRSLAKQSTDSPGTAG